MILDFFGLATISPTIPGGQGLPCSSWISTSYIGTGNPQDPFLKELAGLYNAVPNSVEP